MGYRELLGALEDEVKRQLRQIEAETDQACERLTAETRRELTARRQEAFAQEGQRLDEETGRAVSRARFEQARTLLTEQRRLLADLRQEAERRLPELDSPTLLVRLVGELETELEDGPVELRVSFGQEAALEHELARCHPELGRRATVIGADGLNGGVVATLEGGRQLLDNSLSSRLESAWQQLEAEVAADLFGDTNDGRV